MKNMGVGEAHHKSEIFSRSSPSAPALFSTRARSAALKASDKEGKEGSVSGEEGSGAAGGLGDAPVRVQGGRGDGHGAVAARVQVRGPVRERLDLAQREADLKRLKQGLGLE